MIIYLILSYPSIYLSFILDHFVGLLSNTTFSLSPFLLLLWSINQCHQLKTSLTTLHSTLSINEIQIQQKQQFIERLEEENTLLRLQLKNFSGKLENTLHNNNHYNNHNNNHTYHNNNSNNNSSNNNSNSFLQSLVDGSSLNKIGQLKKENTILKRTNNELMKQVRDMIEWMIEGWNPNQFS